MSTATASRPASRPAGLTIGTARLPRDLDAAHDLLRRQLRWMAALAPGAGEHDAASAEREVARLCRHEDGVRLVLVRRGGRPVGVARVRFRAAGELGGRGRHVARITHLYVVPEVRGSGVGEALVSHVSVMSWWFGCASMRAATTAWTEDAVRLLHRVGFRPVSCGVMAFEVEPPGQA